MMIGNTYNDGSVRWRVVNNVPPAAVGGGGIPLGSIVPYTVNGDLPEGYLICNGAAVLRNEYPDLFDRIGTSYGAGDGSTTFNVPDLRDKFIEGSTSAGTNIAAGLPNIKGYAWQTDNSGNAAGRWNTVPPFTTGNQLNAYSYYTATVSGTATKDRSLEFDASLANSIYGNSTTVQPPSLTMIYIIKAYYIDYDFDHTHENATTELDGFMSKEDKSFLNNLSNDNFTILPYVKYDTLGSSTVDKTVFESWLKYMTANHADIFLTNRLCLATIHPNGIGLVIGLAYSSKSSNGLYPSYSGFLYIPVAANGLAYFGTYNGTYYYRTISSTAG
jgi:microcystin-dependent protein